jgi:ribose transport system permease protein
MKLLEQLQAAFQLKVEIIISMKNKLIEASKQPVLTMLFILLAISITFSFLAPSSFATTTNLTGLLSDVAILLTISAGATYVIILAGIDLSVGSVLVFSGVMGGKMMERIGIENNFGIAIGFFVCLLSGLAWGLINGLIVALAKVPPFVVTLGTLGAAYGLALVICNGIDVRAIPADLVDFGNGRYFGIPLIAITALIVLTICGVALRSSVYGQHSYAIGSNPESARRAGINVDRHVITVYSVAGLLSGFASFLSLARYGTTTIAGNQTLNLQVITAVVIGGTSLFGGTGWMLGTLIGVFIPVVLANGFIILGISPYWQYVAVGMVLIIAVTIDQRRRLRQTT